MKSQKQILSEKERGLLLQDKAAIIFGADGAIGNKGSGSEKLRRRKTS